MKSSRSEIVKSKQAYRKAECCVCHLPFHTMWCSIHQRTARRYGAAAMIALKPALGFADRPGLAILPVYPRTNRRWLSGGAGLGPRATRLRPVSSHLERVPNTTRAHAEPGRGSQLNLEGPRGLLWTLVASSPKREKYLRTFLSKVCTGRRTRYRRQRSEHPRNPHHRDQNWSTQISVDAELFIIDCLRHVTAPLCVVSRRRRVHRVCTHVSRSGRKGRVVFDPA